MAPSPALKNSGLRETRTLRPASQELRVTAIGSNLRLAVIGCGFQGTHHALAATGSEHVQLVLCCDIDKERAATVATSIAVSETSNNWEEVLSRSDIDAVVIATTTNTHAELAIAAAKAGKHALVEKPMATSVKECIEIEEAVRDAGTIMMVGFKFRFAPAVVAAKEAVAAPIVLSAHTLYDLEQSTSGWINDRSLSGGRLMSTLVHSIDLLRFLAGSDPVRVAAEGGALAIEGITEPDNAVATILFESGAIASVVHGTAGKSPVLSTWSFQSAGHGVNATVFDHGRRVQIHRSGVSEVNELVDPIDDPFATGMGPMMDAFAASVARGTPTAPGPRDGTIAVLVSRLIERAITTGENQQVDLSRLTH